MRNAYKILVGKPEEVIQRGRLGRWSENNNGTDLREVGWGGVDWFHLARNRDYWWLLWTR